MPNYYFDFVGNSTGQFGGELLNNFDKISEEIVKAGAEIARQHMQSNAPRSSFAPHARVTAPYYTPSDGAIAEKAYFGGYRPFRGNRKSFSRRNRRGGSLYITHEGIPVGFVAAVFYHGRKNGRRFPVSKSFLDAVPVSQIEAAMQKKIDEFKPKDTEG